MSDYDVIVIGGGPAGLGAAATLGRALRSVLVLDAGHPRNEPAAHVHNLLGREGASPQEVLAAGRREVELYGGRIETATVTGLAPVDAHSSHAHGDQHVDHRGVAAATLAVTLADGRTLTARRIVVATGLTDVLPDLPGLRERWGKDVLHCPYCHGYEVRGQRIVVVGTGKPSVEQAKHWRQWSPQLTLVSDVDWIEAQRLRGLGITVVNSPVVSLVDGVHLEDGRSLEADAVVWMAKVRPNADGLGLDTTDLVMFGENLGSYVTTDPMGKTSVPGVFAVGNVAAPQDIVASAAASGVRTAAAVNVDLIAEDSASALSPQSFWDTFYTEREKVWSGNVNRTLAQEAQDLPPGRALDLGSGEGGDAIWLAARGWDVTAVDASQVALDRAERHAAEAGLAGKIHWQQADLTGGAPEGEFDLVSAQFFLSPVAGEDDNLLAIRAAAARVARGGVLTVGTHLHAHGRELNSLERHLEVLGLGDEWELVTKAQLARTVTMPDGTEHHGEDGVLTLRRGPAPSP